MCTNVTMYMISVTLIFATSIQNGHTYSDKDCEREFKNTKFSDHQVNCQIQATTQSTPYALLKDVTHDTSEAKTYYCDLFPFGIGIDFCCDPLQCQRNWSKDHTECTSCKLSNNSIVNECSEQESTNPQHASSQCKIIRLITFGKPLIERYKLAKLESSYFKDLSYRISANAEFNAPNGVHSIIGADPKR